MSPGRPSLRRLVDTLVLTDSDLEALCIDHFPEVARRFTSGMDRVDKVTKLLVHVEPALLVEALRDAYPQATAQIAQALSAGPAAQPPATMAGRLVHVPELPPHFLGRPDDLASLKQLVLGPADSIVAVTGRAARTGVQGMGGIGKTVLAASLARDDDIRRAFPDGIFWVTLGQTPLLMQRQAELCAALGEPAAGFDDAQQARARLTDLLCDCACLLILDDVWHLEHVTAFGATGPRGRVLFTTRDASIVGGLGAQAHRVDVLGDDQALALLADWSCQPVDALPVEARAVVGECGNLPLGLAMIGAMVRGRPDRWANALHKLQQADLAAIRRSFPDYPYPDLLRAVEVSLDALDPVERVRYLDFAVFPEDTPVPEAVLQTLWKPLGLAEYDTQDLVDLFVDRSLMRRDEQGRLILHDLQRDYLVKQAGELGPLHQRMLDAYAARAAARWARGPDDGYYFAHLGYHLVGAGRGGELRWLLFDFDWLRAKLGATEPAALLADFARLREDQALRAVEGAIRLSAHILGADSEQLAPQLIGRLHPEDDAEIQALLAQGAASQPGIWLRPLAANLIRPGGPLLRTLSGHSRPVTSVAITADRRYAVSGSVDQTLRVWDLENGRLVRTVSGHSGTITQVAITPDERYAVASSDYRKLKVWDIQNGHKLHTLLGHAHRVRAVAVTADGRWAISGSDDRTIKLWDIAAGRELRSFAGHSNLVKAVAVTPDGRRAVSGSCDHTLKVWDLDSGPALRTLSGHSDWVNAVAVTPDGRLIVSGSEDRSIRVWDLETGRLIRTITGHAGSVRAVAVTPDGRAIISASSDETLKLWQLESGRALRTFSGHSDWVNAVAVSPDGEWAISGSDDMTLKVWDLTRSSMASGATTRAVKINAVALHPDGRSAVAGSDELLRVWDVPSGRELCALSGHMTRISAVAVTADGRRAISGSEAGGLRVWDLDKRVELRELSGHATRVRGIAVTADGRTVVSSSDDETVKVWDIDRTDELRTLACRGGKARAVAVSPDGRWIVSGSDDRTLTLWELETGRQLRTFAGHTDRIRAVALSPDARWIVSSADDRTLRWWEADSGRLVRTLSGHQGWVYTLSLSADARRVVSGSADRTVRVWDLDTGSVLASLIADSQVHAVAFAADGRSIVAGDALGTMHFLRLEGV